MFNLKCFLWKIDLSNIIMPFERKPNYSKNVNFIGNFDFRESIIVHKIGEKYFFYITFGRHNKYEQKVV